MDEVVYKKSYYSDPEDEDVYLNEVELGLSKITPLKMITWFIENEIAVPDEFKMFVQSDGSLRQADTKIDKQSSSSISSDEKKKLAELKLEKEKWDSSIDAATRVGLLFYENGLDKPATKEAFIKEFSEQLADDLPDTTIDKIYKALPVEYKLKGGRPKKSLSSDAGSVNSTDIKAAVYAGSIYDTDDVKSPAKLKKTLLDEKLDVPTDEILSIIVAAVKDI